MRRFIIISALVATAVATALACGPWIRPNYYMFSAFNRNQMGETHTRGLLNYWRQYCNNPELSPYDISGLSWVSPQIDDFENSQNELVKAARDKNDSEMTQYLQLLCAYLHVCDDIKGDTWNYPTKQQLQDRTAQMDYIYNRARSYTGTRLAPQYELLAMRTQMVNKNHQNVINRWMARGSKLPESVFKDMARGIYANALLNTGKRRQACEIYAELGDMRSIKWVMRDNRNLQGIKAEYKANPNSPTLIYLVQDYVNSAQSTFENLHGSEQMLASGEGYDGLAEEVKKMRQAAQEMREFVNFAQQVVKEKKTQVPALWMSAAGHVEALSGNNQQGIKMLEQAMKMKGSQRMLDNARLCRLMASLPEANTGSKFNDFLLGELQWLTTVERDEAEDAARYGNTENHYSEMISNLCYDYLGPQLAKQGNTNLAIALMAWCDGHEQSFYQGIGANEYVYSGDTYHAIDNLTADQMMQYQRFVSNPNKDKLERYLIGQNRMAQSDNYFNDRIGTKLLREGRFQEAAQWLEKVSADYYGTLAISAYMAHRNYTLPRWFFNQRKHTQGEQPTPVATNQKLDFARDIVRVTSQAATVSGEQKARALYDLASMYYQASCKGNCWYLTRYGNSIYDEPLTYPNEVDYVAQAVSLLEQAIALTDDFDLKQRCIYANAFIPFGEPYVTYTYDADYNQVPHYNTASHEYRAMKALETFYRDNSNQCNAYVSRCDILHKFMAAK